jgi:transcription antitermination protein NusB
MEDDIQHQGEYNELISDQLSVTDQRSLVFHLLYALEAFEYQVTLESIADNFNRGYNIVILESSAVFKEAQAIASEREQLDSLMVPLLANWRFDRLGMSTRIILRIGAWEILRTHTDPIVIINECIELAKCFAEKDAYKFINGVLDQLTKKYKNITQV